jgi:hypothetical protein
MSALGQKRTFAMRKGMSALPPKADITGRSSGVANLGILQRRPEADAVLILAEQHQS